MSKLLILALLLSPAIYAQQPDIDHDGLPDTLEQQLLEKFRPTFMINATECDFAPAEFKADHKAPVVLHKNGTIYGQAFLATAGAPGVVQVELHYYHLWSRDCGRLNHPLDAEHISTLVQGTDLTSLAETWRATYWYAAAHQDTLCDASSAAKAAVLKAEQHGPVVWISNGKHASFFVQEDCERGCGGDRCRNMKELKQAALINIGEKDAPLNGASWINATTWQLPQKLQPDFTPTLIAQIDTLSEKSDVIGVSTVPGSVRGVIRVSNTTTSGLATGKNHTGSALSTATKKTGGALGTSYRAVKGALGGKSKEEPKKTENNQ
jgi:hypothetical protein